MKPKILDTHRICLYCGKEIKSRFEEYQEYFECNCPDALKKKEIEEKIRKLKMTVPPYNYIMVQKNVLYKNDDDENI